MPHVLFFVGVGMMAFLDFSMGTLIVSILGKYWQSVELPHLVIGGLLALLPDFDIVLALVRRKHESAHEHHTSLMHRPFFTIPAATGIAAMVSHTLFDDHFWTVVTFACVVWHFMHDTQPLGGGTAWLWPFSDREWSFAGPAEKPATHIPLDVWMREFWHVPSTRSFVEILLGTCALSLAMYLTYGQPTAGVFFALPLVGTFFVWGVATTYRT